MAKHILTLPVPMTVNRRAYLARLRFLHDLWADVQIDTPAESRARDSVETDGTYGNRWLMPSLHRDTSDCYSQLIVRGGLYTTARRRPHRSVATRRIA
jgi:hypothetical protein